MLFGKRSEEPAPAHFAPVEPPPPSEGPDARTIGVLLDIAEKRVYEDHRSYGRSSAINVAVALFALAGLATLSWSEGLIEQWNGASTAGVVLLVLAIVTALVSVARATGDIGPDVDVLIERYLHQPAGSALLGALAEMRDTTRAHRRRLDSLGRWTAIAIALVLAGVTVPAVGVLSDRYCDCGSLVSRVDEAAAAADHHDDDAPAEATDAATPVAPTSTILQPSRPARPAPRR